MTVSPFTSPRSGFSGSGLSVGSPKFHALAVEVWTVSWISPSAGPVRVLRLATHGSGEAFSGAPVQSGTKMPPLKSGKLAAVMSSGTIVSSRMNRMISGNCDVPAGALMLTCWPKRWKPGGSGWTISFSMMETLPPTGSVTDVSIGSPGSAPKPVVTLPPGGTVSWAESSGAGVGVIVGVFVSVGVGVFVGVFVSVGVSVSVGVGQAPPGHGVFVAVGGTSRVLVTVGVMVGVGSGGASTQLMRSRPRSW